MSIDKDVLSRWETASSIAADGGALALASFRAHGLEVRMKSSELDLVTHADLLVERFIVERISSLFPDDGIVAEEGDPKRGTTPFTWAVDPIDGTANFALGLPHWCVSVGVLADGVPVAGAIFDPLNNELFSAARGAGARVGPDRINVRRRELRLSTWALGLAEDLERSRRDTWERVGRPRIGRIRAMGSLCLDFAWCAAGYVDACFYECGLKPWDYGAAEIICQEAGLQTFRAEGSAGLSPAMLAYPKEWTDDLVGLCTALV